MAQEKRPSDDPVLQTIQSIQRSAAATEQTSQSTNNLINSQGEEISRFQAEADQIEGNVKIAERMVAGLKSFGGRLMGWFEVAAPEKVRHQVSPPIPQSSANVASTLSVDHPSSEDAALDEISRSLQRMKTNALNTRAAIRTQNATLEQVSTMVDRSRDGLKRLDGEVRAML